MRGKPKASEHKTLGRIIESRGAPKPRPKGQKKFCGSRTIYGVRNSMGGFREQSRAVRKPCQIFICLRCKSWDVAYAAPEKQSSIGRGL